MTGGVFNQRLFHERRFAPENFYGKRASNEFETGLHQC
jgi:hypothetical protein